MKKRPPKHPDLLNAVHAAIQEHRYILTQHVHEPLAERDITRLELLHILQAGWHEAAKDQFIERLGLWNYAIRGRTSADRDLRAVVAIDSVLFIITIIDLDL